MNIDKLSDRLQNVANFILQFSESPRRLVDIGSDHAYLPCYLAQKRQIDWAIAGEIADGPLQAAKTQIQAHQLNTMVEARKGDGFEVIQSTDQINVASICGMGGNLITNILEEGRQRNILPSTLVLQANNGMERLRKWLNNHSYAILAEDIVLEKDQFYEMLVAKKQNEVKTLNQKDFVFGSHHLQCPSNLFYQKWRQELSHQVHVLNQLMTNIDTTTNPKRHAKIKETQIRIAMIQEVLNNESH
ncbi:tRNA (adenine(22)-N(1))-methyltransferase TrmK [Facklamia sp. DSM 111018]|uniref:tRNA (Adenine(22)-N(1))-methyltransferase TrmK n=1 Tax=Facklamia lactis TaxID=2749967 RepID=A0ABS0LNB3_9LACT|nr:tRNA (adenine(22)-N(1))-methyltransferase TrmK [Facklamia lactis]MBG9979863.1 tRNA (adenine(22)-N(1))-methyltransferase TrmK [Facklamia lactis]MBG9985457.1 tRNA (adenine(22)-N(1))-methyltransferase TrmK [Facklamia lactis]